MPVPTVAKNLPAEFPNQLNCATCAPEDGHGVNGAS